MITVYVEPITVDGDRVSFSWEPTKAINILKKNSFFLKYDGVDLSSVSTDVHWNSFLAIMLPILDSIGEQVLIVFPESIPSYLVETWVNFHEIRNTTVFPLVKSNIPQYNPAVKNNSSENIGILFGGGKDSSYTLSLLSEFYKKENITIISYVFPQDSRLFTDIDMRREKFTLNVLETELNLKVQKIYTDIRATLINQETANKIHTAIYTGTVIPIILKNNINYLTYSYEFNHYFTSYYDSNDEFYSFKRSRPEYDDYLSQRSNSLFSTEFAIKNFNYFISETVAFKVLTRRYPNSLKYLLMCESTTDPNVKWCTKCAKCAEFVLYSMCYKYEQNEIDLNSFFVESNYINRILNLKDKLKRNNDGNMEWNSLFINYLHYQSFCHVIASIDNEYASSKLNGVALENYKILKDWFGNKEYPIYESFIEPAFEQVQIPMADSIKKLLVQYCPITKDMPSYLLWGNSKVVIDYNKRSGIPSIYKNNEKDNNIVGSLLTTSFIETKYQGEFLEITEVSSGNIDDLVKKVEFAASKQRNKLEFYIDRTNPSKGDFVEWSKKIVLNDLNPISISFSLYSPYFSDTYKNRIKYEVYIDETRIAEEDISSWGNKNIIAIAVRPKNQQINLVVRIVATKNCESWNWGYAGRISVSDLLIEKCHGIENLWVSATSPFTKLYQQQ